jgi:hypothetical protein
MPLSFLRIVNSISIGDTEGKSYVLDDTTLLWNNISLLESICYRTKEGNKEMQFLLQMLCLVYLFHQIAHMADKVK